MVSAILDNPQWREDWPDRMSKFYPFFRKSYHCMQDKAVELLDCYLSRTDYPKFYLHDGNYSFETMVSTQLSGDWVWFCYHGNTYFVFEHETDAVYAAMLWGSP